MTPYDPHFYVKILSYYQKGDVYKKTRPMDEWQAILYDQIFLGCASKFVKNFAQFWKFLSEFWRVISDYTYQQVINSIMGSNMAPLMVRLVRVKIPKPRKTLT